MPCMKDYGKTWDENGPIPWEYILRGKKIDFQRKELKRYRKIANQYGVCKFVRIDA